MLSDGREINLHGVLRASWDGPVALCKSRTTPPSGGLGILWSTVCIVIFVAAVVGMEQLVAMRANGVRCGG